MHSQGCRKSLLLTEMDGYGNCSGTWLDASQRQVFSGSSFPRPLWKFMSSAIMIPFHKLAQMEHMLLADPKLRPITIGALLTRFSVRAVLRMKRKGIAENLLRSNQCSYGISSGVQAVITGCTVALHCNLRNANTDCSRGLI